MNNKISDIISTFSIENISEERKEILNPLIQYIKEKTAKRESIRLNFICTHNSRRSHLSQVWAQTLAFYFGIKNVFSYSGGTEATAVYPKVIETLKSQGFHILMLSETSNPVYAVKFANNELPVICFSKIYNNEYNPTNNYVAIMTCDNADEGCPLVVGAEKRFPIKYSDPKAYDNTNIQTEKYLERSLEIAQEMWYIFKQIA